MSGDRSKDKDAGEDHDRIELQDLEVGAGLEESGMVDDNGSENEYVFGDELNYEYGGMRLRKVALNSKMWQWLYIVFAAILMRFAFGMLTVFPDNSVQLIGCGDSDIVWDGRGEECGIGGEECLSRFLQHDKVKVRCSAFCSNGGKAWNVIRYADKVLRYEPFVIRGVNDNNEVIFRGDSFPCMAGMDLGYVSEMWGGSIELELSENWRANPEFNANFPASFTIKALPGGHDLRVFGIMVGIILTLGCIIVVAEEVLFYFSVFGIVYTTVVLCGDPPVEIYSLGSSYRLISIWIQRLVPLTPIVWLARGKYKTWLSKLMWLVGLWFTSLDNLTFEQLPIDRLVWEDIKNEKGGVFAIVCVLLLVISCALYQARILYNEGKLKKYVINYSIGLIVLTSIGLFHSPGLSFRIHHWVIGLVLVWGCREVPPSSTLLHGLCLGLIVNGIGRWGFASILEPVSQVSRDYQDAKLPLPQIDVDFSNGTYNITGGFDECRLYVNDILYSYNCTGSGLRSDHDKYIRAQGCLYDTVIGSGKSTGAGSRKRVQKQPLVSCRWATTVVVPEQQETITQF